MSAQSRRLVEEWTIRHPRAGELYQRARKVFPSGVTHDNRYMEPYPIYVTHAQEEVAVTLAVERRKPQVTARQLLLAEIEARREGLGRIPVIALTAYAMKGDAERFLAEGFDGFIAKPVRISEVVAFLNIPEIETQENERADRH